MPGFVKTKKQEALWKEAKSKVKRNKGMSDDEYWGAVTKVYKNMGGMKKSLLMQKGVTKLLLKAETSKKVLKWRKKQKRGAIMKPKTFEEIKKKAMKRGLNEEDATEVAGRAYWDTVKKKFKDRKKKKVKS